MHSFSQSVDMDLIHRIQKGFPTAVAESLLKHNTLTRKELYKFIPPRTWARRVKEHRLSPEESDRLAVVERIVSFAEDVFGDKNKAHAWLRRPNRSLENQTPLDLLHSEIGTRLVETILGRIQHGIYS
jgi:putative toxin-antitoxin system antitoxin component (TIGR02293 family)